MAHKLTCPLPDRSAVEKMCCKMSRQLSLLKSRQAATKSVHRIVPQQLKSRDSAATWASSASTPCLRRASRTHALSSLQFPWRSRCLKARATPERSRAGKRLATDKAKLCVSKLLREARTMRSKVPASSRELTALSLSPSTGLNAVDCKLSAAVGRRRRSSSKRLRTKTTAGGETPSKRSSSTALRFDQYLRDSCASNSKSLPQARGKGGSSRGALRSSKSTTPLPKMSTFGVTVPCQSSGAIEYGVPMGALCRKFPGWKCWVKPKSMSMA
mmetsp:Transcript_119367/g.380668  ORF Transcript_119367/g.380668 Transcript_119367/m.380668 type:complete len:271 (-) Transcript_119367:1141-1953(-)